MVAKKSESPAVSRKKLKNEITIFCLGYGLVLISLAVLAWMTMPAGAPPFLGMERRLAVAVPLAASAVGLLVSGVLLAITGWRAASVLGALSATAVSGCYCCFMVIALGELPMTLITFVIMAIPVLVIMRVDKYLRAVESRGRETEVPDEAVPVTDEKPAEPIFSD